MRSRYLTLSPVFFTNVQPEIEQIFLFDLPHSHFAHDGSSTGAVIVILFARVVYTQPPANPPARSDGT